MQGDYDRPAAEYKSFIRRTILYRFHAKKLIFEDIGVKVKNLKPALLHFAEQCLKLYFSCLKALRLQALILCGFLG